MTYFLAATITFLSGILLMLKVSPKILDFIIEWSKKSGMINGPWKTHLGVGRVNISKLEKSAIARIGLGANSSEEAIYWNAFTDSDGVELISMSRYEIIFNKNLPIDFDNEGFWSITIYGKDKFLVNNIQKKYLIRYSNNLRQKIEFPFIIHLCHTLDEVTELSIPLPAEIENFSIVLRCYRPLKEMKDPLACATISLPIIKKML